MYCRWTIKRSNLKIKMSVDRGRYNYKFNQQKTPAKEHFRYILYNTYTPTYNFAKILCKLISKKSIANWDNGF